VLVRGERKDERVKRGGKKLGQLAAEEAIILEAYHDRFLYKVQFTNSKKNLTVSVKDGRPDSFIGVCQFLMTSINLSPGSAHRCWIESPSIVASLTNRWEF